MSEKKFPILETNESIDWNLIAPHEKQAMENHCGQTLEQSARRKNAGRRWNVRIRELLLLKKKILGLQDIYVRHVVCIWGGQLERFLLVIAGNVVRNWIGVMKNE